MDWGAVGAVGELIGAFAVVLSLVYLSRQVHQNTRALRTGNAATVLVNFQDIARPFITDREAGAITLRAMQEDDTLTPSEKLSAYAWFFVLLKSGELAYAQYRNGELDEAFWEASLEFFLAYWTTPGMRTYWADRRGAFVPEFRAAVDKWLIDSETSLTLPDELYGAPPQVESSGGAS